jgi:hypothetical protein
MDVARCGDWCAAGVLDSPIEGRERHNQRRAGRRERGLQFTFAVDRVERHDNPARLPDPELCDEELWRVGEQERDAVPRPDAVRGQRGGKGIAL